MNWEKAVALALVVGVIGPLFWLGVQVLENKFWLWLRKVRSAKQTAATDGRLLK